MVRHPTFFLTKGLVEYVRPTPGICCHWLKVVALHDQLVGLMLERAAWLDSGYVSLVSSRLLFGRLSPTFCVTAHSVPVVDSRPALLRDCSGSAVCSAACGSSGAWFLVCCVVAPGFSCTSSSFPYWTVEYSWSIWSEGGYIYLNISGNTCGVTVDTTVPVVATGFYSTAPNPYWFVTHSWSAWGTVATFMWAMSENSCVDAVDAIVLMLTVCWQLGSAVQRQFRIGL